MTVDATGRKFGRRCVALGLVSLLALGGWWLAARDSAVAIIASVAVDRGADAPTAEGRTAEIGQSSDPMVPARREVEPGSGLDSGIELYGRLNLSHGEVGPDEPPLTLTLMQLEPVPRMPVVRLTSVDSAYSVPGLTPGTYRVRVEGDRIARSETTVEIPVGVTRVPHDIELIAQWNLLVGIVTPEGRPLLDVIEQDHSFRWQSNGLRVAIVVTHQPPARPISRVTGAVPELGIVHWTGEQEGLGVRPGTARPLDVLTCSLSIPAREPVYVNVVLRSAVLASEVATPGQSALRLVVAPGTLVAALSKVRFQVVDLASDLPMSDMVVGTSGGLVASPVPRSDADGRVSFTCAPGVFTLTVTGEGRSSLPAQFEIAPGSEVDLGRIAVTDLVRVHFDFEQVPSGEVVACRVIPLDRRFTAGGTPSWRDVNIGTKARSGPAWLFPGRYLLLVTAGVCSACCEFAATPGITDSVVVTLQPAARVRVIPPREELAVGLAFVDARGIEHWSAERVCGNPRFVELVSGSFVAEIRRPDGYVERRPLVLTSGITELDLR